MPPRAVKAKNASQPPAATKRLAATKSSTVGRPSTSAARKVVPASSVKGVTDKRGLKIVEPDFAGKKPLQHRWLSTPKMRYLPKTSLPQLLMQAHKVPLVSSMHGGSLADGTMTFDSAAGSEEISSWLHTRHAMRQRSAGHHEQEQATGGLSQVKHIFEPAAAAPSSEPSESSSNIDSDDEQEELNHMQLPPQPREPLLPKDSQFAKQRRAHPRLRWPRLAKSYVRTGLAYMADGTSSHTRCLTSCEGIVCGGGGSTGIISPDGLPGVVEAGSPISSATSPAQRDGSRSPPPNAFSSRGENGVCEVPKTGSSCGRPTTPWLGMGMDNSSRRPAILPRAPPRLPVAPGTTSTVNAPILEEDGSVSRPNTALASLMSSTMSRRTSDTTSVLSLPSTASNNADRKWFIRMAPISCLPSEDSMKVARRAFAAEHYQCEVGIRGHGGEYLSFERWGLNDDYLDSVLSAHSHSSPSKLRGVRHMNLSENQITETGVEMLMKHQIMGNLLSLNLASNRLQERGALAVAKFLSECRHIAELDLSGNGIGDFACEELCGLLDHKCPDLKGLGLARNNIGTTRRGGDALGAFVSTASKLSALDLCWNWIHGEGGKSLLKGVYSNGVENKLNLERVNLGWNRLGSGAQADSARKRDSSGIAKRLASVFQDGQVLFHLDLSYNRFDDEDCAVIANGLVSNRTLFGLHLVGNDATVDDLGFVVPIARRRLDDKFSVDRAWGGRASMLGSFVEQGPTDEPVPTTNSVLGGPCMQARAKLNPSVDRTTDGPGISRDEVHEERKWVSDRSKVRPMTDTLVNDCEAVQRSAKYCWICESWIQHRVVYTPGISSEEYAPSEVKSVFALYSIDGFTKATQLHKRDENYSRRGLKIDTSKLVNAKMLTRRSSGERAELVKRSELEETALAKRRVSTVVGISLTSTGDFGRKKKHAPARAGADVDSVNMSNMGTSSTMMGRRAVVTGHAKIERWVGHRMLPPSTDTVDVVFVVNGSVVVAEDMVQKAFAVPKTLRIPTLDPEVMQTAPVHVVNTMSPGLKANEMIKNMAMSACALCVLEDPASRGDIQVVPRTIVEVEKKQSDATQQVQWCFETSSFKDFQRDNQAAVERCFEVDWQHGRLPQIIRGDDARTDLHSFLKTRYLPLILAFWHESFSGLTFSTEAAGVSAYGFRHLLVRVGGEGPGKLIDGVICKLGDPDCIFIAANALSAKKRAEFKLIPEHRLARFQFLEGICRFAFRRYPVNNQCKIAAVAKYREAVENLLDLTALGEDLVALRASLHKALFREDCCMVYKEYCDMLHAVYNEYRMLKRYPGRSWKTMSYGAWAELLTNGEVLDLGFTKNQIGVAFALGKEIRIDEYSGWRYMELSWSEFLVALAAVVRIRSGFCKETFADDLDEFFSEFLDEAHVKMQDRVRVRRMTPLSSNVDPHMGSLVQFIGRVFEEADDDLSGTVEQREFRRCMNHPDIAQEMQQLGVNVSEVNMLFRMLDRDGSGSLTLEELTDGFVKMRKHMKGIKCVIQYTRIAFADVAAEGVQSLNHEEFHTLFDQPGVRKKLLNLGVDVDDINELFAYVDSFVPRSEVCVDDVAEALLHIRDPRNAGARGVKLLAQHFDAADVDESGALSKEEVMASFTSSEVVDKLRRIKLSNPDWDVLFEELDIDGSGDLSWEEIHDGMMAFWAKSVLDD